MGVACGADVASVQDTAGEFLDKAGGVLRVAAQCVHAAACGKIAVQIAVFPHQLNQPARLYVTESIREDAHDLYGFISKEEQRCYELLTSVNGVGPKAAMSILSAGPQNFTLAVMTGDEKLLTAAQGIGKKIAQRIILELKDKIGGGNMELDFSTGPAAAAPVKTGNNAALAHAALQELGYSPAEINAALKGVDPSATTEEMVRHALRAMVMKG